MRRTATSIVVVMLLAGCSGKELIDLTIDGSLAPRPDANDATPPEDVPVAITGLESIEITPGETDVVIDDLTVPHTVAFIATGTFASGAPRDITDEVAWAVANPAPGGFIAQGEWRSSNAAGGDVLVEARSGDIAGTARISVFIAPVINAPSYPPPPHADDLFDPTLPVEVGGDAAPAPVYPAHETMFPINVYRILFQYDLGADTAVDLFRLHFTSRHLDMKVYTTGDRWQADEMTWGFLALTNAGGKVEMTVAGINAAAPATIYESEPIDLYFSRSPVEGAIYYWLTSSEGVMKGVLSDPAPTKFYTEPPDDTCVGCHTVSRDGSRMAVVYDGDLLQEINVADRTPLIPADSRKIGWLTFSPGSDMLLVSQGGELTPLDATTGEPIGPNNGVLDLGGALAQHPDWSPLGDHVAVAICRTAKNKEVKECSLGRIPYDAGNWGAPEILLEATPDTDENNFFPKYSPDGHWIAYVYAEGKSKNQNLSASRLIPADGGEPIVLEKATRRVGPDDDVALTGSTMPTWAPSHPGTQWLAFSSVRDYGKLLVGDKADQLWVVALDLDQAEAGRDPSYAAFWLPLQDIAERNHRAFWAHDNEEPCEGTTEVCDGFDNDCDGIVDENCTPCEEEDICDDGIDNDCDGLIDEDCVE